MQPVTVTTERCRAPGPACRAPDRRCARRRGAHPHQHHRRRLLLGSRIARDRGRHVVPRVARCPDRGDRIDRSPLPVCGATLPGVFSARGLQILLNTHRVARDAGSPSSAALRTRRSWRSTSCWPGERSSGADRARAVPARGGCGGCAKSYCRTGPLRRRHHRYRRRPASRPGPGDNGRNAARVLRGAGWADPTDRRRIAESCSWALRRRGCRGSGKRRRGDCRGSPRGNRGGGIARTRQ